jgi:pyruvate-ferredoxin/flavodoxin oxidoreductase
MPVAEFIASEARFAILARTNPARAAELGALLQADADERWRFYSQLATVRRSLPHTVEAATADFDLIELPTTAGPDEMAAVK